MISDNEVKEIIAECELLANQRIKIQRIPHIFEIYRGISSLHWKNTPYVSAPNCKRQKLLFKEEGIISKYCFDCYKIAIKPRTVIELIKLALLFNTLKLEDNNTRKCFADTRPYTKSAYIGLIYYQSLDDARNSLPYITDTLKKQVSPEIETAIKRGCTKFYDKYPEYNQFDTENNPVMEYPADWFEKESAFEKKGLTSGLSPLSFDTYGVADKNEKFSLREFHTILLWLYCAETFSDESYLEFSSRRYAKIPQINKSIC